MQRLIYVSKSNLQKADADAVVSQILTKSEKWNGHHGATGALIFTGTHFAQVLEALPKDIDELMLKINNDPRHRQITVMDRSPITERMFPDWAMAYQGPSQFVSGHVTRLLAARTQLEQQSRTEWLIQLAHQFVTYKDN